jgi:hypothetical protein
VICNNAHCLSKDPDNEHFSNRTLPDIFHALHKHGALQPMIERMVDAEYHMNTVEYSTRGLYWKTVDWAKKKVVKDFHSLTDKTLRLDITFHPEQSTEWENGEVYWIDLVTGEGVVR